MKLSIAVEAETLFARIDRRDSNPESSDTLAYNCEFITVVGEAIKPKHCAFNIAKAEIDNAILFMERILFVIQIIN